MDEKAIYASKGAACRIAFNIDPAFHMKVRSFVKTKLKEHGGDTNINFQSGNVTEATMQVGQYDKVELNRGVIDWHTHPAQCKNKDTCTIGLPSPSDMANVIMGVGVGTMAHMVYSREGTYVIQVKHQLRGRLLQSAGFVKEKANEMNARFISLYNKHNQQPHESFGGFKSRTTAAGRYKEFTQSFFSLADMHGFCIQLFKGDKVPRFTLHFNCNVTSAGPGLKVKRKK
jgi:muramidase (phage lysozyme)